MAIIYENTVTNFKNEILYGDIVEELRKNLSFYGLFGGSDSEQRSWENSLRVMKDILDISGIDKNCKVAVEYNIPQTPKRVDFMILGSDESNKDKIIIIELKQWAKVEKVNDNYLHSIMADLKSHIPVAHPSFQADSYKFLIAGYCDKTIIDSENLIPCSFMHNLGEQYRCVIEDKIFKDLIIEAPAFLKNDKIKLADFIKKYIKGKANQDDLLYRIDFGRIKPQKSLQDSLDSMLCGNEEFKLIDEQIVAYDLIYNTISNARNDNNKHVIIVRGGPGTGKSVLAINVLANCISKLGLNASYITKNSAPRNCYKYLLSNGKAKNLVKLGLAFKSPHALPLLPNNGIDVGIFDEAHRMQKKPNMYKGFDMLEDAIRVSRISIFLVDEDQRITVDDCYDVLDIINTAKKYNCIIETPEPFELISQFRCGGSDGYIAFLNDLLGINETSNKFFDLSNYEVKVFDNPNILREELRIKNNKNNKSRMLAGYCYDWNVKYKRGEWDIILENDFRAKWNLESDSIWAINKDSFEQVGCIYTCQGMEFDYVGIFIGKDLIYRGGKVITNKNAISKDDHTSKIKQCKDIFLADKLIRNTYKVLLTRGQKGVFIYCEDKALNKYFKDRLTSNRS